jgi:ATPase subunit of ABC transporter with duplicated ATPase domains
MPKLQIILNNISYPLRLYPNAIRNVSLSISQHTYGLVGDNGIGKSTLLKLISGQRQPVCGDIQRLGSICAIPQSHHAIDDKASIADVLQVTSILAALDRIQSGSVNEADFNGVKDHWDIECNIAQVLDELKLRPLDMRQKFAALSGGQKTKLLLAKAMLFRTDFLLLDEPTNNLDQQTRHSLYSFIQKSTQGIMVASHDRQLLRQCDHIIEISQTGLTCYGGNYDFYTQQKSIENEALEHKHLDAIKNAKKTALLAQKTQQQHQKRQSKGQRAFKQGKTDKLSAQSQKGRSERTHQRNNNVKQQRAAQSEQALEHVQEKREVKKPLDLTLPASHVPNHKQMLCIKNLYFKYSDQEPWLLHDFNLSIIGPRRIALCGQNGSGKTSLLKLIHGELSPLQGDICIGATKTLYLDQNISFLQDQTSLVRNFMLFNPHASDLEARFALARMGFRNQEADVSADSLSGGQRMRAALAIALFSKNPPQLLMLDEASNHLDLRSTSMLEQALYHFQGTILAVSHDEDFLRNSGVNERIGINTNA